MAYNPIVRNKTGLRSRKTSALNHLPDDRTKEEGPISIVANWCLAFDVLVSFEIVVGVES
ncbi:MAG: hypothetical protein WBC69_21740 [Geitlerinemataceae cyanobacterium]